MKQRYFEVWRDGQLVGVFPGIVSDEYPKVVAFAPEWDVRAGDELVPASIDHPSPDMV